MKKYIVFILLLISFASHGQFVNYVNINGRYKWIAGKFDSTFTLPSGTTPSLRTGGGTGPGALFYNTADSIVYQYTGSQWRPLHGSDTGRIQIAYVRNTTASQMTTGQVVYINGSTGNVPTVALAQNKQDSSSAMTFGFVRGTIAVNGFGWITTFGPVDGINTNAYDEGEVIYLDSVAGQFTHDKPQAPYHMVTLGYVIKKASNGIIFTKIQNGYELEELHNVKITAPVLNKSVIIYDSVKQLWVDTTVSAAQLGLGGSGTTNYIPKWTSSTALGNSIIYETSSNILINTTTNGGQKVQIKGAGADENSTALYVVNSNATRSAAFRDDGSLELTNLRFYGGTGQIKTNNVDFYVTGYFARENIRIGHYGGVTINDGSDANVDFRIEGDNNANLFFTKASTDNIGMGTNSPNSSALLHMSSTTKGFLPPVMTGTQAEAIGTPAEGLLVYANNGNGTTITSTGWWGYNGTTWVKLN